MSIEVPDNVKVLMPDGSVETIDLDDYLKGVVPVEMGSGKPLEALKAQAIAARTFAITERRHLDQGANICTTTHCQAWRAAYYPDTDIAVEETSKMVATYSDQVIRAFYFGHCDGHTRNSEDVWVQALPYCRSVPCIKPYPELFGHGVGMCQKGAMAMGEAGRSFEEILKHYYTGIEIHKPAVEEKPEPTRRARLITPWMDEPEAQTWLAHFSGPAYGGLFTLETKDGPPPTTEGWTMDVEYRPGVRAIAGRLPRGFTITLTDPYGNIHTTVAGSKLEHGPGGFEILAWVDGPHTIEFLDQKFQVEIANSFAFLTFEKSEVQLPGKARLVTQWMKEADAQAWLAHFFQEEAYRQFFALEIRDWIMTVERQIGPSTIAGILPEAGIEITIIGPQGERYEITSGSEPAFGLGGFETRVQNDGLHTISFLEQSFEVEVKGDFVLLTFEEAREPEGPPTGKARLLTPWMEEPNAQAWLDHFSVPGYEGLFILEREGGPPPATKQWTMGVKHRPGVRGIAGRLPRSNITITVTDPYGNVHTVKSGSKVEYGPGGFEILAWVDGPHIIEFLDQTFQVDIQDNFAFVSFEESEAQLPGRARLVTLWMDEADAQMWLAHFAQEEAYRELFTLEKEDEPAPSKVWVMNIEHQPGSRAIAGTLPRAGITIGIIDPEDIGYSTQSGSQPLLGVGGFEVFLNTDGVHKISFLDQTFQVRVTGDRALLMFEESWEKPPTQVRLVTGWTAEETTEAWLAHFAQEPAYHQLLTMEEEPST